MTANHTAATTRAPGRAGNITVWVLQVLLGLFMIIASAAPKLFSEQTAVEMFTDIGAGQWLRYLVGVLELAGGIGLLLPRLAATAALGLVGLMVGAAITQVFVLDNPVMAITPVLLGVLFGVIAWYRSRRRTPASR